MLGNGVPGHIQLFTGFLPDVDDVRDDESDNILGQENSLQSNTEVVVGNGVPGHIQLFTDFLPDADDIDEDDSAEYSGKKNSLQGDDLGGDRSFLVTFIIDYLSHVDIIILIIFHMTTILKTNLLFGKLRSNHIPGQIQ